MHVLSREIKIITPDRLIILQVESWFLKTGMIRIEDILHPDEDKPTIIPGEYKLHIGQTKAIEIKEE